MAAELIVATEAEQDISQAYACGTSISESAWEKIFSAVWMHAFTQYAASPRSTRSSMTTIAERSSVDSLM